MARLRWACAARQAAMARGELDAVVATSSLDLGIDWADIELVIGWRTERHIQANAADRPGRTQAGRAERALMFCQQI